MQKYNQQTHNIFETIGTFFVDKFYNQHYRYARRMVSIGQAKTVTDAYRGAVIAYVSGLSERKDLYFAAIKSLYEYYQDQRVGGAMVNISYFEDKILSEFIPAEYYADFDPNLKDNTLRSITLKLVGELAKAVLEPSMFTKIIDDHANPVNVGILQDRAFDFLVAARNEYYSKFANIIIGKKSPPMNVDASMLDKLKSSFVQEKRKVAVLEAEKKKLLGIVSQLLAASKKNDERIANLEKELENIRNAEPKLVEPPGDCPNNSSVPTQTPSSPEAEWSNNYWDNEEQNEPETLTPIQPGTLTIEDDPGFGEY